MSWARRRSLISNIDATYRTFIILGAISLLEREGVIPRYNDIALKLFELGELMSPTTLSKYLKTLYKEGLLRAVEIDARRGYVAYSLSEKGTAKLIEESQRLKELIQKLLDVINEVISKKQENEANTEVTTPFMPNHETETTTPSLQKLPRTH